MTSIYDHQKFIGIFKFKATRRCLILEPNKVDAFGVAVARFFMIEIPSIDDCEVLQKRIICRRMELDWMSLFPEKSTLVIIIIVFVKN